MAVGTQATAVFGETPFIAINMGGKDKEKDWGQANWERLIAELGAAIPGAGLLAVGAPSDSARALALRPHWPGPLVDACGVLSVRECAAALEHARIFIGHDSGPMHLAASRGVPCIGLFGDFNRPAKWHPYGSAHRILHRKRLGTAHHNAVRDDEPHKHRKLFGDIEQISFENLIGYDHQRSDDRQLHNDTHTRGNAVAQ